MDPSNKSHPLHSLVLSIFESKNKTTNSADFISIKQQLKQCGLIFLMYNDNNASNEYQNKNNKSLKQIIQYLQNENVIKNVTKYNTPKSMNYFDLYHKMSSIIDKKPNKVLVIHCKEHHYNVERTAMVEEAIGLGFDLSEDESYGEEDEWLTFEPEEDDRPQYMDLAVGGAKDITHFRQCILEENSIPNYNSITYCGLFYEYYFDKKSQQKRQQDDDSKTNKNELFSPSYFYARNKLPGSNVYDTYISVGLSSNIKANTFKRPKLNLVIVLDVSGSMSCSFSHNESGSKMDVAKKCLLELIKHLSKNDRFGLVLFNHTYSKLQPLELISNIDMNSLQEKVQNIQASGGTTMGIGFQAGIQLFDAVNNHGDMIDNDEYDENDERLYQNRLIFLTDAITDSRNLIQLNKQYSNQWDEVDFKENIYSTFIGIGVDFNDKYIKDICECRGSNYFSVHSNEEFSKIMNDEFDLMVSPILFNLKLEIKSPDNSCVIDSVYGVDNDDEIKSGTVMHIYTLFPSKPKKNTKKSKGGLVVIKLKKSNEKNHVTDINGILNQKRDPPEQSYNVNDKILMEARVDYEYEIEYEFDICKADSFVNQNENSSASNKFETSVECSKYAILLQKHINKILDSENDIKEDEKELQNKNDHEKEKKDEKENDHEKENKNDHEKEKNEGKFNMDLVIKYEDNQHKIHTIRKTVHFEHDKEAAYYDNMAIRKAVLLSNYVKVLKAWIVDANEELVKYINTKFIPYFEIEAKEIGDEQLMNEVEILNKMANMELNKKSVFSNVEYVHNTDDYNIKQNNYGIKQMLLTYNPLQSIVVNYSTMTEIKHPMDIYHNAYCHDFISADHAEITEIYPASFSMRETIESTFSTLMRYNKKYEVILIPISMTINDAFLNDKCTNLAINHENIAEYRISFIYRQFIYTVKQFTMELFIHNQDEVTISGYIRNEWNRLKMSCSFPTNEVIKLIAVWYKTDIKDAVISIIKLLQQNCSVSGSNSIEKWFNIGCGSLVLCDVYGISTEIHIEDESANKITRLLFLCQVDCRIPYDDDIIEYEFQCSICKQLLINPSNIGNPECSHIFCYNCIQMWKTLNNDRYRGCCPICRREVNKISVQQDMVTKIKTNTQIPSVIYSQIADENGIFCKKRRLIDAYVKEREIVLQLEADTEQAFYPTPVDQQDNINENKQNMSSLSEEKCKLLKNMDVNEFVRVIVQEATEIGNSFDEVAFTNILLYHEMDVDKLLELGKVKFCKIVKDVIAMGLGVKIYMKIKRQYECEQSQ